MPIVSTIVKSIKSCIFTTKNLICYIYQNNHFFYRFVELFLELIQLKEI
jgi:hypothetical protein